ALQLQQKIGQAMLLQNLPKYQKRALIIVLVNSVKEIKRPFLNRTSTRKAQFFERYDLPEVAIYTLKISAPLSSLTSKMNQVKTTCSDEQATIRRKGKYRT
ncbi:TPA: hypothetical protein ACHYUA_003757, partial [Enterobacter hormaechei]